MLRHFKIGVFGIVGYNLIYGQSGKHMSLNS